MKPPQRSLVLALVLCFLVDASESKEPVVEYDPQYLNYGQTATITVTFDPPCPQVSIFRRGMDAGQPDQCVFGPKCGQDPARPKNIESAANPAGNWVRFTGVNAMANGRYYAQCPSNNETYEGSVLLSVKPRILAVEFGSPQFGVQVNLTRWQNGRQIAWNSPVDASLENVFKSDHAIPVPMGESYITFLVGMGVDPNIQAPQATSPKLFTFDAPEFDDNYAKVMPREKPGDYIPFGSYPTATRIRYRLNRNWLAYNKICQLKTVAVAALNGQFDKVTLQLDFIYDPTVANITMKHIGRNEEADVGHACDCLFTCHVSSCPIVPAPLYDFEWNFPLLNQVSPRYIERDLNRELMQRQNREQLQVTLTNLTREFMPGNVVGFPAQFLINATTCRDLYQAARDLMRTQQKITFTCRVAGGNVPANKIETKLFDFMEKFFRDECKTFRAPELTGEV